jgi:L-ascorbate metabolism protein UlaG (beta-lactamase superfamily)
MQTPILALLALSALALVGGDQVGSGEDAITVVPIEHASLILSFDGKTIYVDPVGGAERLADQARPDLLLITHAHGDHLDVPTLEGVVTPSTRIVATQPVADKLPEALRAKTDVLGNGEGTELLGVKVEAIPAYNLTEEHLKFHPKGVGNGYVLTLGGSRVYLSGDTEDIPEMRALKDIDIAFVCINQPYTMTVEQAADAVLAFKPKVVYPYHFRGQGGKSDLAKFKELVSKDPGIEVRVLDWYPQ